MAAPVLPEPLRIHYPFESRFFVLRDGLHLHYVDEGPADGPVLLFVHGYPLWSFEFRALIVYYAALGWRCVALDHIGFGLSDKPTTRRYHTLAQHVENLTEFITGCDLRDITLVLEDWGGPFGLSYALARPETVRRLVLMNTWAFQDTLQNPLHQLVRWVTRPGLGELFLGVFPLVFTLGVQRWTVRTLSWSVLSAYKLPFREMRHRAALVQFPRLISTGPDHPSAPFMRALEMRLPELRRLPTLIVWGAVDPVFPLAVAQHWKALLPRASGPVLVDSAGHFLAEDAPDELVRHLDAFLEET